MHCVYSASASVSQSVSQWLRHDALLSGVTHHGRPLEALQDMPQPHGGTASADAGGPASQLRYCLEEDDDDFTSSGKGSGSGPAAAAASEKPSDCLQDMVVFRVAHKDISGLKRPLSSVDNVVSGDIAVKLYTTTRSRSLDCESSGPTGPTALLVQRSDKPVVLLRLLDLSGQPGFTEQDVIRNLKVWRPEGAEEIQLDPAIQTQLESEDLKLMLDMMAARAFAGSGRTFQVYGPASDWQGLRRLRSLSMAKQVASFDGQGHDARRDGDNDLEGEWALTAEAVGCLSSRIKLGSPSLVFSPRPNIPLQDRTTLELYLNLTAKGFQEVTDNKSIQRAKQRPHEPGRGMAVKSFKQIHT